MEAAHLRVAAGDSRIHVPARCPSLPDGSGSQHFLARGSMGQKRLLGAFMHRYDVTVLTAEQAQHLAEEVLD